MTIFEKSQKFEKKKAVFSKNRPFFRICWFYGKLYSSSAYKWIFMSQEYILGMYLKNMFLQKFRPSNRNFCQKFLLVQKLRKRKFGHFWAEISARSEISGQKFFCKNIPQAPVPAPLERFWINIIASQNKLILKKKILEKNFQKKGKFFFFWKTFSICFNKSPLKDLYPFLIHIEESILFLRTQLKMLFI